MIRAESQLYLAVGNLSSILELYCRPFQHGDERLAHKPAKIQSNCGSCENYNPTGLVYISFHVNAIPLANHTQNPR